MKVSRPVSLKLDRDALLADVRARLESKLGAFAGLLDDPSDPGWLLIEEAAWMTELLSGQLDEYPWAVMRQLVHLMGGQLRPARPSIGVVCLRPIRPERLVDRDPGAARLSFSANATESRERVRFTLLEDSLPLVNAKVDSVADVIDGQLHVRDFGPGLSRSLADEVAWVGLSSPSEAFEHELVRFVLLGTRTKELKEALERGVKALADRGVGWLSATVKTLSPQEVALELRVDVAAAFAEVAPGGLSAGGDLEPAWGTLTDSVWTPPVSISDDTRLPLDLRLGQPLPGNREGRIRVPDVPPDFPIAELLVREPVPMPSEVVAAAWRSFVNADRRLASIRPKIERRLEPAGKDKAPAEASWLGEVMRSDAWARVSRGVGASARLVYITLPPKAASAGGLRLALVDDPPQGGGVVPARAYGVVKGGGLNQAELELRLRWTIPLPPAGPNPRLQRVSALEIGLEEGLAGVLLVTSEVVDGVLLNAALVGNMPVVTDNRELRIERTVPTSVSLLDEDLVSPDVMAGLLSEPLPADLLTHLRAVPLSRIEVKGEPDIRDLKGVEVDPSTGEMVLNSPDTSGALRTLKPGTSVKVLWYRRTQGADGNLPAGALSFVEQKAGVNPRLVRVSNPMPTYFGQDRELDDAAVERIFGAATGAPVLAADWEREIRVNLGTRGADWMVRVWTYAERAHLSGALWPWNEHGEEEVESLRIRRALDRAGPEVLTVFVGDPGSVISERDLDWARRQVEGVVRRARERVPTVRSSLVDRLWPLTLDLAAGAVKPPMPCYDVSELRGALVDSTGRRAAPPRAAVILNGPVVEVAATRDPALGDGSWR